jgi:cation:H+ antiporter
MERALLWLQFAVAAALILAASQFLARSADTIGYKTRLGRSFVGVVLLATVTSLPELATGVSAVTIVGEPDIAAGDLFGASLYNLLTLALMDLFWRNGPILNTVTFTTAIIGSLGIITISLGAAAIFIHHATPELSNWRVSPISVLMLLVFIAGIYLIYRFERSQTQEHSPRAEFLEYERASALGAVLTFISSAAAVVGAAIWLADTADRIADAMEWEASFVGTQFVALSTTLPELSSTFAAIRLKAADLALANQLGSNFFNTGVILFVSDLAYSSGSFWAAISEVHMLTAAISVVMTSVVIIAVLTRPRKRPIPFLTIESALLIALFVAASVLIFNLG